MFVRIAAGALAVVIASSLLADCSGQHPTARSIPSTASRSLTNEPLRRRLTARQINRQDDISAIQANREARAHDRRPLLNVLPITLYGVTFDIGGLAPDGRTAIIDARSNHHNQRRVQFAFRILRRRLNDRSRSYRIASREQASTREPGAIEGC